MPGETGLFLVDKPAGPSSFGVLRRLHPALGRKLGHAGTLDPFATGLLLVVAGGATRLATYLSALDKRYEATVQFGVRSTTLDPEGELTPTGAAAEGEAVARAAATLVGEIDQRVPAASAVHVDGERSYARLRRGLATDSMSRRVRIDRVELLRWDAAAQRAQVAVECSKGAYVRQIADDLGDATGAGAYCLALRRLAVGPFDVTSAGTPEDVAGRPHGPWFREPVDALPHLPLRQLDAAEADAVAHGRAIEARGERGPTRLSAAGVLWAVAVPREGRLAPVLVL